MAAGRLRAIIFDFNGVIADDETPHLLTFQQALQEEGLALTKEAYYEVYLGMDERNCAIALVESVTGTRDPVRIRRLLERKAALFRDYTAIHKPQLFPGVVRIVKQAGERYRLAIASGGTREQIKFALQDTPIEKDIAVIVSAEDTTIGKPDPAVYRVTLNRINRLEPRPQPPIGPEECLVIEDSLAGVHSAKAAGMQVLGLATTYSAEQLSEAHLVIPALEGLSLDRLEKLFGRERR
jgi:HAD superfamily hydrolase (TIGR01509 family)